MALPEPGVDLEVAFLDITAPGVLFFEQVGLDLLEALVHLVGVDVKVLAPVLGDVVE